MQNAKGRHVETRKVHGDSQLAVMRLLSAVGCTAGLRRAARSNSSSKHIQSRDEPIDLGSRVVVHHADAH
jgi:hypothetical protein